MRNCRRFYIFLALALLSGASMLYFLRLQFLPSTPAEFPGNFSSKKMILTWTPFFGRPMDGRYLVGCPFANSCFITYDQSNYEMAHALVFHPGDMNLDKLPPKRYPEQIYVFLSHESPPHTDRRGYVLPNFFNWTMTYRMDSDVPFPYAYMRKTKNPTNPMTNLKSTILKTKTKKANSIVTWFASNCYTDSKREQYVAELRKHIPVDVYGRCGNHSCPRSNQTQCDRLLNENYKFYLAFENSLCLDYVTEKFYGRVHLNAVPIVLKRSLVENLFPPRSFIAADDFKDQKSLATYLTYLNSNDTAYLQYFEWRNQGYILDSKDEHGNYFGFCGLCQRMLDGLYESKSYSNMKTWWVDGGQCDNNHVSRLIASTNRKRSR